MRLALSSLFGCVPLHMVTERSTGLPIEPVMRRFASAGEIASQTKLHVAVEDVAV
ncbi:MAG: hypothetical protein QOE58_2580 [Actinomycetota bacterium]|nr:hypothetical protein [Actinomycetota bacterium]